MAVHNVPDDSMGDVFVSITGETTLTEHQHTERNSDCEIRADDVEMMLDISSTVRETGLEDALATPEVD
ncbi:hypothetical protein ACH9L7_10695 [Haloferax sp. S1W]|uniref:hypothetical protein n=1 Tax=Haloferax sp. S1W TaxID=3377110 RepID=UPI0037C92B9B